MIKISFRGESETINFIVKRSSKVHSSDVNHFFPKNLSFIVNGGHFFEKEKKELANVFLFMFKTQVDFKK